MKCMKKLAAMMLTLIMALALAVPAFAADTTYTITVPSGNNHTYEVYQIFTGDLTEKATGELILSNVKWGANSTQTVGSAVSDDVITELTDASGSNTEKLNAITQYVNLNSTAYGTVTASQPLSVPGGYYLIKDEDAVTGNDASTLYIVKVAGDINIEPKSSVPTAVKKVKDTNDTDGSTTDWQDSADWDIGDEVPFKLEGTVASNYADYTTYKFVFHDKESAGLDFNKDTVMVYVGDSDTPIDSSNYKVVDTGLTDNCTFEVRFDNLKNISGVAAGTKIRVEYTSTLTNSAVFGSAGNPNEMYLEFSNNPNTGHEGETGTTPTDKVIVFTYKTIINKVKTDNSDLAGAAFKLEKVMKDGSNKPIKEFIAGTATSFTFTGLDDGDYILTETKAPEGFNAIDPITFRITATHDTQADAPTLTALNGNKVTGEITFTSSVDEGSLSANVVNKSGATLPETGGMGTTMFYVIGGILVVGAGVLLITKKRMSNR